MAKINDILDKYSDTELAYLNKYQIDSYLESSQVKIRDYIFKTRGLSENSLDSLIAKNEVTTFNDNKVRCPRCKTDKVRADKVNGSIPFFRAGSEDEFAMLHEIQTGHTYKKEKVTCNICGYVLYDLNNEKRPLYKKIADFVFDNPLWLIFLRK